MLTNTKPFRKNIWKKNIYSLYSFENLPQKKTNILYILLRFSLESFRILADFRKLMFERRNSYFKCFCLAPHETHPSQQRHGTFLTSRTVGSWSHWCILRALFKSLSSTRFCSTTSASSTSISTAPAPRPPCNDCTAAKAKSISCSQTSQNSGHRAKIKETHRPVRPNKNNTGNNLAIACGVHLVSSQRRFARSCDPFSPAVAVYCKSQQVWTPSVGLLSSCPPLS